ncbi:MAG: CHAT domain-containing protein [Desulfobacterales bacterium]|nr:CHAT domain-containing protein [Desulfobacterales bacterium]
MSVQEAQDHALEFQEVYKTLPPRGLGTTIERSVKYYKDPPIVPREFLKPQKKYTDEDLEVLSKTFTGNGGSSSKAFSKWSGLSQSACWRFRAYDEFLLGNISLALRMIDFAVKTSANGVQKAMALGCKAIFLSEVGDYKSAEHFLSTMNSHILEWRSYTRRGPSDPVYLTIQRSITRGRAAIYFAQGNLKASENEYYRAIHWLEKLMKDAGGRLWWYPELKMNLARVLMWQGRLTEAEIVLREAIRLGQMKVLPHCYILLSNILFEQGRFEDASVCARTALHMAMSLRVPVDAFIRANARETYARALIAMGKPKEALEQYNLIEKDLKTDPEAFERRFRGNTYWGLALLMNGNADGAIRKFEFALNQSKKQLNQDQYVLAELGALRAMALNGTGKKEEALAEFARHVPKLLNKWQTKGGESAKQNVRTFKFSILLEAYIALLAETPNTKHVERSFYLANALQDKINGKAVALSSARAEVDDPELAELIRQQQDLEIRLTALKNRLANSFYAPPELINTVVAEELQKKVNTLNLAASTLGQEIKNRFPDYANLINPDNVDVVKTRNTLDEDEALISIFSGRKHTFIWAVPKTGSVAMAKVPISKSNMTGMVVRLRKALNPGPASTAMEIPAFDLEMAHQIYEATLKPVADGWKQAKNLLVVTRGPIGQIPLAILPTTSKFKAEADKGKPIFSSYRDVDWLIKNHSVTVLPSISALVNLRSIKPKITEMLAYAGFGDPYFNLEQLAEAQNEGSRENALLSTRNAPIQVRGIRVTEAGVIDKKKIASIDIGMLNRLPDTREEVINIAATLKADTKKDVFLGKAASEQMVKSMDISNRRVVVFATHGLVAGDLDGLNQPALALSATDVTGDKENDGLLTMGEIMGLRLNADWVVLSACNTGAAEGEGAEAVSGLGQAFFYAGARSLLVTGWPVETVSAKLLTTDLFKRQLENPDINRAEALQLTMKAMIAKNHSQGFSYAHPIFWAPFAIVGDGRR